MNFARLALKGEILQNGLRKKAVEIIRLTAKRNFIEAINQTHRYISMLDNEIQYAKTSITSVKEIMNQSNVCCDEIQLKRKEVAELINITVDTLRNWELNGLLKAKRKENGYRIYNQDDIKKLQIIRSLRCGNYSLSSILRLLNKLSTTTEVEIEETLSTPSDCENIISVCDKMLLSLSETKQDAQQMLIFLENIKKKYSNPPV